MAIFTSLHLQAQDTTSFGQDVKNGVNKTGSAIKKGAKKTGNKTAELASKGKAAVVDKVYDGKVGQNGETIYINDKSQYYWIDSKGHRHYVTKSELKDKDPNQ